MGWSARGDHEPKTDSFTVKRMLADTERRKIRLRIRRSSAGSNISARRATPITSVNAKARTIAAPVGISSSNDAASPTALAAMPPSQPIPSTPATRRVNNDPIIAGMIKKQKMRGTPAVATELVKI